LIADAFNYDTPSAPIPQGLYHHRVGYNVAYTDGHVRWIPDPQMKVSTGLYANYPASILWENHISEDVWDAFDGDIGYQPYTWVSGLIRNP
jgi:prepilin-type processing-associated H-X9-DG protein